MTRSADEVNWISTGGSYPDRLTRLSFPMACATLEPYDPESTILKFSDGAQTHVWLWCYLERRVFGKRYLFNPSSLSPQRVRDMPRAIERLSKRYRFDNSRPRTIASELASTSRFMNWLDDASHKGRYEQVLSDPDLALDALRAHHSHLRNRMQAYSGNGGLTASLAADLDVDAIRFLSAVHDRDYDNELEAITYRHGTGVKAPEEEAVASLMACLIGVFDSVARIDVICPEDGRVSSGHLTWQSEGRTHSQSIPSGTHVERLLELGCMAFAAICIGDSGANLGPIQTYEAPEELQKQLANPDRLTLRHKAIKFRAGGKMVPVHLTSIAVTRLSTYMRMREALCTKLGSSDIDPMFVQCRYPRVSSLRPLEMIPLRKDFTGALRKRFSVVGIKLPKVTMQQLRAFKAGKIVTSHDPQLAADIMGHSVSVAIRKYCKLTEAGSRFEVAPFLKSLTSTVLARSKELANDTPIPPGKCSDYGHPRAVTIDPVVVPDCKKTEGCFFCDKFHVHADEEDCAKLMSCHSVLERLAPRAGESGAAVRVYAAVNTRIIVVLEEIMRINPVAHERARIAVHVEGKLSHYWACKLQQLHLLGLLAHPPTGSRGCNGEIK